MTNQIYFKDIMTKCFILLLLTSLLSSCIDRGYDLSDSEQNFGSSDDNTDVDYSLNLFQYPYEDEGKDINAEIIVKVNEDISMETINIYTPHLKYNKSWLLLFSQDDCAQSAFCRTWAAIHGKPISNSDTFMESTNNREVELYYLVDHLKFKDLPDNTYCFDKTLGSTDGTGKEVRFSFTSTISPEEEFMSSKATVTPGFKDNQFRFFRKPGLTWNSVIEMLNYDVGLSFHDVMADDLASKEDIHKHFGLAQNIVREKLLGRGLKVLAEPNGNALYLEAAKTFDDILTLTAQSNEVVELYPFLVENDQTGVVWKRIFNDSPQYFKELIIEENSKPKKERKAICIGAHNTDNDWCKFLKWVNDTYGQDGDDSVWFTSQEEYYEYNYYRNNATPPSIEKIDDKTYRISIHLPSNKHFYFPSTTLNIEGIDRNNITSIETDNNITGFSYANFENGIMMNIDCRKFLANRAEYYVNLFLQDKSDSSNKNDALYFINQLKDSSIKSNLLNQIK